MRRVFLLAFLGLTLFAGRHAAAQDRLCDPAFENCRDPLLALIKNERVAIDVAFWFMEDARYTAALRSKAAEGVRVRVLVDTRANSTYSLNADRLEELRTGGIPMRRRVASGILHWKMMLFEGQNTVQFSAANYTSSFVPIVPYENYIDEAIYFTSDTAVVDSFRTKFDDLWTDETRYADYANVTRPLVCRDGALREDCAQGKDPELNFPPRESYRNRAVARYDAESAAIDVIMYRITDRTHTDAMIRAIGRGVPVRLITEPRQYRDRSRYWHSWNVDRLYAAGATIRHRGHAGLMHQKSVLLRGQRLTIFGSSNWTSPSSSSQEEHNYFTAKPYFFQWFTAQFERKWWNQTGRQETTPFVPLPPDRPAYSSPAHMAVLEETTSATLVWNAGIWAHLYDIHFGTTPDPPLLAPDRPLGPSVSGSDHKSYVVSGLVPGTTYYWRVVAKTMANQRSAGPVSSFTVGGSPSPTPTDIVMYASRASTIRGDWSVVPDGAAAGNARIASPDATLTKVTQAAAAPADYFELTFHAEAGKAYHLWIRGRAERDYYGNDSVHVQFSGAVSSTGAPVFRIGTIESTVVCIEAGSGAGLSGWGWEDNGWGSLGPHIYFAATGTQTIRVQRREDGISIDQIVLSPVTYLTSPPGSAKNDTTILPEANGGTATSSSPVVDEAERVLYASRATIVGSAFVVEADPGAASGAALSSVDRSGSKVVTPLAAPAGYAELTFTVEADRAYRLWLRARAAGNYWGNDSVHLQFSGSVDRAGSPTLRIGSAESAIVNLEDCSGCGLRGWGWQDNGYGVGVLGPVIYFQSTGPQKLRIQNREDGLVIDQIVLSPAAYLERSPGSLKDDTTILTEQSGT